MKSIKTILNVVLATVCISGYAQDFSDPRYAKWGDTPEQRRENILNSTFLKESIDNRDYAAATGYLKALVEKCPTASENIYVNGIRLYKNKIARAKTVAEKKGYVDSLMWVYDLRNQYFGSHPKRGTVYILDRKARELLTYDQSDRAGIRKAFEEAIDASIAATGKADPELMAIYFKNLCDDYTNTDEVSSDYVLSAYEKLAPLFDGISPEQLESKEQFETCFGMSGAASCENLESLFKDKLAADPDNLDILEQAVMLMTRANCESDFFLQTAEKYYALKPSADTALFLAQVFQNKKEFDKANTYLREAVAAESNPAERVKLLVRISVVELAAQRFSESVAAARDAIAIEPENGYAYFILAQGYALGNGACSGLAKDASYWVAYDTMTKAISLLGNEPETQKDAQKFQATYRNYFPTAEECFFNEIKEGSSYTVSCGAAKGISTTVRFRQQ